MTVYQHAALVTVNDNFDVIENGTLAVEGKLITYVGPYKDFENAEIVDCTGKVILPGFINGHSHLPMTLFRGYADDMRLQEWLSDKVMPMEARHTKRSMRNGALLAALELTRSGCTTVNDMYYDGNIIAETLKEAGMSGTVSSCLIGAMPNHEAVLEQAIALAEKYKNDPDIRTAIAPHAEYTATPALLEKWGRAAIETGQPIHIHCSETLTEHEECIGRHGLTPVALFDKLGMTEVPMYLAHCVYLSDEDMEIVKAKNLSVLHNPCSNLKLGSGIARLPKMLEMGLNIALSTDGSASNNTEDMWEEMRIAGLIHKGANRDATAVSANQALYIATRGAARALGYADRGSLEAGMRADFTISTLDVPSMRPLTNITNLIVYSGNSRDIEMTVAGGKVLYDHGEFTKLDKEKIFADCQEDFETLFR